MEHSYKRGDLVVVRTFGGFPRIRKLWLASPSGCVVAEDEGFQKLLRGDISGAVAVPPEDVFYFTKEIAERLDPKRAFEGWGHLIPIVG